MKVKLIHQKDTGYVELVVADSAINKKYGCKKGEVVVLAVINEFFSSGCWSVLDLRLSRHRPPSPYLEAGPCIYIPKNNEDKDYVTSHLHTYRIKLEGEQKKETILWNTWDLNCWDGDNPSCQTRTGQIMNQVARFSGEYALQRLKEIEKFWLDYEGQDVHTVKIDNPYRQESESFFSMRHILDEILPVPRCPNISATVNTKKLKLK